VFWVNKMVAASSLPRRGVWGAGTPAKKGTLDMLDSCFPMLFEMDPFRGSLDALIVDGCQTGLEKRGSSKMPINQF